MPSNLVRRLATLEELQRREPNLGSGMFPAYWRDLKAGRTRRIRPTTVNEYGGGFNRSVQHSRFSVLSGSEVRRWRSWVVQEGCPRRVRRSCGSVGGSGSPSATSPEHYTSLPAPFMECSKPPAGSLHPSGAGGDARSPWASGRRSPEGLRPGIRCASLQLG